MLHLENLTRNLLRETLRDIKISQKPPAENSVLAIIMGGSEGIEEAFMALRSLKQDGYWISIVASTGAVEQFGIAGLKDRSEANNILIKAEEIPVGQLVKNHAHLIVPIFCGSSVGKLANGIWDTFPLYLIYQALLQEREIVAAENSMMPYGKNKKLIDLVLRNKHAVQELGIRWVDVTNIIDHIPTLGRSRDDYSQARTIETPESSVLDKKLITVDDLKNISMGELKVKVGTIITPLALDYAREKGITLIKV